MTPRNGRRAQISLSLTTFSAEDPGGWAQLREEVLSAERSGIDRVVVPDHLVFGENLEAYADPAVGGTTGGRQPTGPDGHWLEPLTVLAWTAGFTDRIRLGTNILIAALRRPAVLAKELATLDVISGGRVDLGVGVGWQREEYDAAGLAFERRGALLDHTLEVCRELWGKTRATFADEFLSFEGIHQMPKPLQPASVPIWVSGTFNPRVVRRLVTFGCGWIPWGPAAGDLPRHIPLMKQAMADLDHPDVESLEVVGNLVVDHVGPRIAIDRAVDAAGPLIAAGVTDLRVRWGPREGSSVDDEQLSSLVHALSHSF